jgi:hypothetical protein
MCRNHPERRAIGVCIITGKAICAECSTRYEGVNYSIEGLRILQERRAAEARKSRSRYRLRGALVFLLTPGFLYLVYLGYFLFFKVLINLEQSG